MTSLLLLLGCQAARVLRDCPAPGVVNEYPPDAVQPILWAVEGFLSRAELCVSDITLSEASRFDGETWEDAQGIHVGFYGTRSSFHVAEHLCDLLVEQGVLEALDEAPWRDEELFRDWSFDGERAFLEACGRGPPLQLHALQPAARRACGVEATPTHDFLSQVVFPKRTPPLFPTAFHIGGSSPWEAVSWAPVTALGDALASVDEGLLYIETPTARDSIALPLGVRNPRLRGGGVDAVLLESDTALHVLDRHTRTWSQLPALFLREPGVYLHPYWVEAFDGLELVDIATGDRTTLPATASDQEATQLFIDPSRPRSLVLQNTRTTGSNQGHRRFWRVGLDEEAPELLWRSNGLAGEPLLEILHVHQDGTWTVTTDLETDRSLVGRFDPHDGQLRWVDDLCSTRVGAQEGFLFENAGTQRRSFAW